MEGKAKKSLCPLNPWISFILSFLLPWVLISIIVAANYHTMNEKKKRNIFIIICILVFFVGSAIIGSIVGYLQISHRMDFIFYTWNLIMGLSFTLVQLPDYKKWRKSQIKEDLRKIEIKTNFHKIKVLYISSWIILLMNLVLFPFFLNHLLKKLVISKGGVFTNLQWGLILSFSLISVIVFWGVIKKYVVPKTNIISSFSLAIILYSMGTLPAGLGLIVIVALIVSNFTILGLSTELLLWIIVLSFGTISIHGLLQGNKLLNQLLISTQEAPGEEKNRRYLVD